MEEVGVELPEPLIEALDRIAADRGATRDELILDAVRSYVAIAEREARRKAFTDIRAATQGTRLLASPEDLTRAERDR